MKIVVLGGGISTERHVSLVTASSVCKGLRQLGHKAVFVDMFLGLEDYDGKPEDLFDCEDGHLPGASIEHTEPDLEKVRAMRKDKSPSRLGKGVLDICRLADCVFLGLHGADGEDGKIQAALDLLGVPYTGSDYLGSAMAMNKATGKIVMEANGILTPPWKDITYTEEDIPGLIWEIPVPCVVKTAGGGSSIGVEFPESVEELRETLTRLLKYGNHIIAEKKIEGTEITVPVLGDRYLSPIEIVPPEGSTFDYVSKYQSGNEAAREICPARISEKDMKTCGEAALKFHRALGLKVYSRTDFILDAEGRAWCLEVNTLPGMTPASLIPKAALLEGLDYPHLCKKIVELSLLTK